MVLLHLARREPQDFLDNEEGYHMLRKINTPVKECAAIFFFRKVDPRIGISHPGLYMVEVDG